MDTLLPVIGARQDSSANCGANQPPASGARGSPVREPMLSMELQLGSYCVTADVRVKMRGKGWMDRGKALGVTRSGFTFCEPCCGLGMAQE